MTRAIVAGGGLVGLTTAMALGRIGYDVLVCERAPELRAAGAFIGLWPNAHEVFTRFGIGAETKGISTPVEAWFYDAAGQATRAPGYGLADHSFTLLPRPRLNEILADAAGRDRIRYDAEVVSFDEHPRGVRVRFADGTAEEADLLIGADGVHSAVRRHLVPESAAREHVGHHAWRAVLPAGDEPAEGSILTVGHGRSRGGYARTAGGLVTWMVNQFDCPPLTGSKKDQALARAALLNDGGWGDPLVRLIERTPEELILHNQIMLVPVLPRWTSGRVALIGDAAHGLSPHVNAGGTLGIEDVGVLVAQLTTNADLGCALKAYATMRMSHFETVRAFSRTVEQATTAAEYAGAYAAFSHWMLHPDGASRP